MNNKILFLGRGWLALAATLGAACEASLEQTDVSAARIADDEGNAGAREARKGKRDISDDPIAGRDDIQRVKRDGKTLYIVEGDIPFDSAAQALSYLERASTSGNKSLVHLTSSGARDVRADQDAVSTPNRREFRYCFQTDDWGAFIDTDGNGTPDRWMPAIADVRPGLEAGMRAWEGVTNVFFVYDQARDGASCIGSSPSFRISLDSTSENTASGAVPSASPQELTIPRVGIDELLAIHEVGHLLGLHHEHVRSDATPSCAEPMNGPFAALTDFDSASALIYANCTTGLTIAGNLVSSLDGVGARILYGNPDWWIGSFFGS